MSKTVYLAQAFNTGVWTTPRFFESAELAKTYLAELAHMIGDIMIWVQPLSTLRPAQVAQFLESLIASGHPDVDLLKQVHAPA